jgi:hypothetical protein
MRWLLLTVCGGLVLAGAVVAATATSPRRLTAAPAASPMPLTADQAELGKSIRAYLLANPEVLVDAMQELERKQDSQRDAVAQKGVLENQAELYRDLDSPVGGNPNGDVAVAATTAPASTRPPQTVRRSQRMTVSKKRIDLTLGSARSARLEGWATPIQVAHPSRRIASRCSSG